MHMLGFSSFFLSRPGFNSIASSLYLSTNTHIQCTNLGVYNCNCAADINRNSSLHSIRILIKEMPLKRDSIHVGKVYLNISIKIVPALCSEHLSFISSFFFNAMINHKRIA